MKKALALILGIFFFCSSFVYAAETYTIDPSHTAVIWHISHFGFSHPTGKWMVSGTILFDEAHPDKSTVEVTIPVNAITTGDPELDKHLNAPLFFDTEKFPTATFVSNKIDLTGKESAKIYGTLTLHGVAKPVTLTVKLNKMGPNPLSHLQSMGLTGSTTIKRSDFGIVALLPGLGDDVTIEIELEANKK